VSAPVLTASLDKPSYVVGDTAYLSVAASDPDQGRKASVSVVEDGLTGAGSVTFADPVTVDVPGWTDLGGYRFSKLCDTVGTVSATVTVKDSQGNQASATASAPVAAKPVATTTTYPVVASIFQNTNEQWADAAVRNKGYGYNGFVRYLPAGRLPSWDSQFQALASKLGSEPINLQLTYKTHDDAGLAQVLSALPEPWRPGFKVNYFQEPEDNLLDAASQKAYRDTYARMAAVCRRFSWASLPWVEWQEWTLDPLNTHGWDLANFAPAATDYAGVLWSFFEYGQKDRIAAQVLRVVAAMAHYAPGKPWALMASAYTIPASGATDAQRQAQAAWLSKAFSSLKAAGCQGFAWYDYLQPGTGGSSGESRLELNPYAAPLLAKLAAA
jgi:hypothetical protein